MSLAHGHDAWSTSAACADLPQRIELPPELLILLLALHELALALGALRLARRTRELVGGGRGRRGLELRLQAGREGAQIVVLIEKGLVPAPAPQRRGQGERVRVRVRG